MILSLVRNNSKGRIGFLAMKNRINVLLSRAKHGMYILGNAESLRASNSTMWDAVLDDLGEMGSIGTEIEVTFHQHCFFLLMVLHSTQCEWLSGLLWSSWSAKITQMCAQKCHHWMIFPMFKTEAVLETAHFGWTVDIHAQGEDPQS